MENPKIYVLDAHPKNFDWKKKQNKLSRAKKKANQIIEIETCSIIKRKPVRTNK